MSTHFDSEVTTSYFVVQTEAQIFQFRGIFSDYASAKAVYSKLDVLSPACIMQYKDKTFAVVESFGLPHAKNYFEGFISLVVALDGKILNLK